MDNEEQKLLVEQEVKSYQKLEKINQSAEFQDFFALQVDTAVQKIMQLVAGNGPKDWDEFCKVRGEIIGILYPIQQVRGSKTIIKQLTEQINTYYNTQPE